MSKNYDALLPGSSLFRKPRILTLDIETSPNVARVWGLWGVNISISQLIESSRVLMVGIKWHGESKAPVYSEYDEAVAELIETGKALDKAAAEAYLAGNPKEIQRLGHRRVIQHTWDALNEADWVITYNGPAFDIKHLQREFALLGFTPPSPYKNIDLLRTSRGQFKFPSNKLDYVAQAFDIGSKLKHQAQELWNLVLAGDSKAWTTMKRYCAQDVRLTEELFNHLGPWVKGLPNLGLWTGKPGCYACGSTALAHDGWHRTAVTVYERLHCTDCGAWNRKNIVKNRAEMRPL